MLYKNEKLHCISTEDYYYLTENFQFVDAETRANQVKYLVYNKDKKIMDTMQKVMENELTEKERQLAIDYWSDNLSIGEISKKHNISRSSFYRMIGEIKKKFTFFKPKFELSFGGYAVDGNYFEWDYEVKQNDKVIATISKEFFHLTDTYVINVEENDALVVLMIVLAIDAIKDEQNHHNSD